MSITLTLYPLQEIRLELDESKLSGIIMELDILHRAIAPEIIEFYGAFMVESCVYYCIEFMDAGSLDALNFGGIPEKELARITKAAIKGLKFLKDELQVMHRGEYRSDIQAEQAAHSYYLATRRYQMSSRPTCSPTRKARSNCVISVFRVSLKRVWPRPTSGVRATWR
jgi:hypothetical protein